MEAAITPFPAVIPCRRRCLLVRSGEAVPRQAVPRGRPPSRATVLAVGTAEGPPVKGDGTRKSTNAGGEGDRRRGRRSPAASRAPSLAAALCNAWEDVINRWVEPRPLPPSVDPDTVLVGNFAPVPELPPTPCAVVKGSIPSCLGGGAYIRNGPNPRHAPRGPHHLFDGDGMLHSLLLPAEGSRSPPLLCSRFVRTNKYTVEDDAGDPLFPSFFTFRGLAGLGRVALFLARVLTGQLNPDEGLSPGNVSLSFFHDRLVALGEPDLPYVLRLSTGDGDLTTVGRAKFESRPLEGMTAHPKVDPGTGEVFAFRYRPIPPFLTYFRFDGDGKKQPDVPISAVRRFSLFHDFAITGRYAIIPDIQIAVDYPAMAFGGGSLFRTDPVKVPRIGVIPRYAASEKEMTWLDVPGFNPMHTLNAWEEEEEGENGGVIVLVAPNMLNVSSALERMEQLITCVEMLRIDLKTKVVTRTPLSVKCLDMGVINPAYTGKKNRYAYLGVSGPFPKMKGVAKLDFELAGKEEDCAAACRIYGPGRFGGEPFFVAKDGAEDEDDGYVVTYVHDETTGESSFLVMDAKSPALDVVAEVLLPRRVPYGFHGFFARESELRRQHE